MSGAPNGPPGRRRRGAVASMGEVWAAAALAAGVAGGAAAQPVPYEAPTSREGAYAAIDHAAGLRLGSGWEAAITASQRTSTRRPDGFGAAFAYAPGRYVGVGTAFGWAEAHGDVTLALAAGTDRAAVGVARAFWFAGRDAAADGVATTHLSATARPLPWFGLSFAVRNVETPRHGDAELARVFVSGLALRSPSGALELDGHLAAEPDGPVGGGVTLRTRPARAVHLFATGAWSGAEVPERVLGGLEMSFGGPEVALGAGAAGGAGALVASAVYGAPGGPAVTDRGLTLRVDLAGDLAEVSRARLLGPPDPTFTDTLISLHRVAIDPAFEGVFVNFGGLRAGPAQLFELRTALERIRDAGKFVAAYYEAATIRDLYVGSVADFAAAPPTLSVLTTGLGVTRYYFADVLARVGVEAQFERIGAYKSGPERFTHGAPSAESAEQLDAYLDVFWALIRDGLDAEVDGDGAAIDALLAATPLTTAALQDAGLLDAVVYRDELTGALRDGLGHDVRVTRDVPPAEDVWADRHVIAVLHISGAMVDGDSTDSLFGTLAGGRTIAEECRALADDAQVDAVIVRIDSGGGSALAADTMQRALGRLAGSKPTFVSLGDVAASGGIYAAAFGAPIRATPATLTGSIGIYAGTFAVDGLFELVGLGAARTERGGVPDLFDGSTWDAADRAAVHAHIAHMYGLFLDRVATARGMTVEEVDAIGQGRIWAGVDAQRRGLVDALDGFLGAYQAAVDALDARPGAPIAVVHYPEPERTLVGLLPELPQVAAEARAAAGALGVGAILGHLGVVSRAAAGAPMAQLEYALDGL